MTQSLTTPISTWYPVSVAFDLAVLFALDPSVEFNDEETFLDTFLKEQLLKFGIVQL